MRALLSLPPVLALATLSASCPHPQEALLGHATVLRAQATLGEQVRDLVARKSPDVQPEVASGAVATDPASEPDEGEQSPASAWGVPALPTDAIETAAPEVTDDVAAPGRRYGVDPASGPMAWMNDLAQNANERIFATHGARLVSIAKETWIYEKPRWKGRRIGGG